MSKICIFSPKILLMRLAYNNQGQTHRLTRCGYYYWEELFKHCFKVFGYGIPQIITPVRPPIIIFTLNIALINLNSIILKLLIIN